MALISHARRHPRRRRRTRAAATATRRWSCSSASAWTPSPTGRARACLWRRQARRARDRARQPAEASAHGRADRRHGARGARRADAARRAIARERAHRRALHRARHGRRSSPMPTASSCWCAARSSPPARRRRCGRTRACARSISATAAPPLALAGAGRRRVSALLEVEGLPPSTAGRRSCSTSRSRVGAGEVVSLMGRNGAGKSTTLKAIMGLVTRRAGRLVFAGRRHPALASYRIAPPRPRLCAGGPAHLHRPDGAENLEVGRQPPRARRRRAVDARAAVLRSSPISPRCATGRGGQMSRRRAADAHHRPHADGQPARRAARRAVGGPRAGDRRADGARDPRA